jgi:DNA-binding transcriptional ArsR family regulator
MVKYTAAKLDRTFHALADPTRRALLKRLATQPDAAVSALARPFGVTLPAVMKHLDVLRRAGLVERRKTGRTVHCRLVGAPLADAMRWLAFYERFWAERIEALADYVEHVECPTMSPSPSPDASRPRPRASGRRGAVRTR